MAILNIFSAGAAQAVVTQIVQQFEAQTGHAVNAIYGAVGAMKAQVVAGKPADVIVLTAALIDELIAEGRAVSGSRVDLGKVGTGVAVRAGTPLPDVSSPQVLRANSLAATRILCPDPAVATAGKVVMRVLEQLGILEQVKSRIELFPNGYAAMGDLAASRGVLEMGITQVTEIIPNKGVKLVGPLPPELQVLTTYSVGLAAKSENSDLAREFIRRLTGFGAQPLLVTAGYQIAG